MIENLFLSVGAMKSGTTWLYEQLRTHPDIFFTPEKEVHYFANVVGIENQLSHRNRLLKLRGELSRYVKGNPKYIEQNMHRIQWYLDYAKPKHINDLWYINLFAQRTSEKYCADFSNLYCQMGDEGWQNVYRVANNVKVVYTLRDPLSRLWSHYKFHMKWVGKEREVIDAGFDNFKNVLSQKWFWANAEYAKNYQSIARNNKSADICILYFEDVHERPGEALNKVVEFLGLPHHKVSKTDMERKVNPTQEFSMPYKWRKYAMGSLEKEIKILNELGLWHESWRMS